MKFEDALPDSPTFTLSTTGKTYELRLPTLEDRVHWQTKYGSDQGISDVFTKLQWKEIATIAYRLMKDKSDFIATQEEQIDDNGFKATTVVPGPLKLIRAIRSQQESVDLIKAITAAIMAAEPLVKEMAKAEFEKKSQELNLTGLSSSNSLLENMATPPSNSGTLPTESSTT